MSEPPENFDSEGRAAPRTEFPPLPNPETPTPGHTALYSPAIEEERSDQQATTPQPPAPSPLSPGRRHFGKYELLEEIAQGGMGVIYKAHDLLLNRVVALKMIRSGLFASTEEIQRFYREAQAAAKLKHDHIIALYEIDQCEGQHFFTMAFAARGSLSRNFELFAGDPRATAALVQKVARAVQYAHDNGILHRDLKPGNVLLDERGEPLVSDFGLAKFLDSESELTQTHQLLGTPAYLAPEQITRGSGHATRQTDVWSLGILLYELLACRRPFKGESRDELYQLIRTADPEHLTGVRSGVDQALETIVWKCLEKEPGQRYQSAGELADELGRWLRGEPIRARPQSWWGRTRRSLRRHWLAVLAVLLGGLAALAVTVLLSSGAPEDPEAPVRAALLRLGRGEKATLLGATGEPIYSRWVYSQGAHVVPDENDGVFTLSAMHTCLLELLPNLPVTHYRFEAEVRHDETGKSDTGSVGIYCLHAAQPTKQGVEHLFCMLHFNDRKAEFPVGPLLKPTRMEASIRFGVQRRRDPSPADGQDALLGKRFDPITKQNEHAKTWRRLAVEVRPDGIEAFWEGQSIGRVSRERLEGAAKLTSTSSPNPEYRPDFWPRGGLGLFIWNGVASFRNVSVEPRKE
jgi:hypothetical protein